VLVREMVSWMGIGLFLCACIRCMSFHHRGSPRRGVACSNLCCHAQKRMFKGSNPGLSRRFQLENAFRLDDFDDEELMEIMVGLIMERSFTATDEALLAGVGVLSARRGQHGFGNAGDARTLVERALAHAVTSRGAACSRLEPDDFRATTNAGDADIDALFADLVGVERIVAQLRPIKAIIEFAQREGRDPVAERRVPMAFRFVGAPGTGKTTIARRMGRMFTSLGVLQRADVHEHSASDLIAGYVGQTAARTRQIFRDAVGAVLFIDEAYKLRPGHGSFAGEALDEIVNIMTEPEFCNRLVVVLAGYEADIEALMHYNAGLKRRFGRVIEFPNMSSDAIAELVERNMRNDGLLLDSDEARATLRTQLAPRLVRAPGFANASDALDWAANVYERHAEHVMVEAAAGGDGDGNGATGSRQHRVTLRALEGALAPILADREREREADGAAASASMSMPVAMQASHAALPPQQEQRTQQQQQQQQQQLQQQRHQWREQERNADEAEQQATDAPAASVGDDDGSDGGVKVADLSEDPDLEELARLEREFKERVTEAFAGVDEEFANDDLGPSLADVGPVDRAALENLRDGGPGADEVVRKARDRLDERTGNYVPNERLDELRKKARAWCDAQLEALRLKEEEERRRREIEEQARRRAEEAARRAEQERTEAARREAEAAKAKAAKVTGRVPVYVCGWCGRPWGTPRPPRCTYYGPVLSGYMEG